MNRDFTGKDVLLACIGADDQTPLVVYVDGLACTFFPVGQIKGDPASQIDAGGFVFLPVGGKAIPGKDVQRPIKAEIGQPLGQPLGVGVQIDLGTLQFQRGAVGQIGGVKIALMPRPCCS